MKRAPHKSAHAVCPFGVSTTWADCDKARDDAYADWQAMQEVILAYNVVVAAGSTTPTGYRKEKGIHAQLIQLIAGDRDDIMNDDGNPHEGVWAKRLRAAIERFKAGDLPVYNLYQPVAPAE